MDTAIKESLWKQFGASIDMFENAIALCPEELWKSELFWYNAYHTLFFLDYYLTTDPDNFKPPPPFTLSEFNSDGELPERVYTKEELLTYLRFCYDKCHDLIAGLSSDSAAMRWKNKYRDYSIFEILIYNMRHVQHHTAQLNQLLRQKINEAPDWVSRTKVNL